MAPKPTAQPKPKAKAPAKPRKKMNRMPAIEQVERDFELVQDRLRPMTWDALAEKYDLSLAQCKRIWADYRDRRRPKLMDADPFELIWESVERYEGWIMQLADIAIDADNDSAKVGAVNSQAKLQAQRDNLLQVSGILPQNLGKLKVEHDVRFIAQTLVRVLQEDDVPIETQRRALAALRPGSASASN